MSTRICLAICIREYVWCLYVRVRPLEYVIGFVKGCISGNMYNKVCPLEYVRGVVKGNMSGVSTIVYVHWNKSDGLSKDYMWCMSNRV